MAGDAFRHAKALGINGTALRLWDKLVTDRNRYKPGTVVQTPARPAYRPLEELAPAPKGSWGVLYLVHCFYPQRHGGTERFVLSLAKECQRSGNRVRVLSLSFGSPKNAVPFENEILWRDFEYEGVPITSFCYKRLAPDAFYKRVHEDDEALERFFSFVCGREGFDLVHVAYAQPYASVLKLCRAQGIPYILTATDYSLCCHGATMTTLDGQICAGSRGGRTCAKRCKSLLVRDSISRYDAARRLLEGAAHVTTPSAYAASIYESEFPGIRVRVVPHGIGFGFSPGQPRRQIKRFVYAGSLSPLKGVGILLDAFRRLPGDASLDVYGSSWLSALRLKRKAVERVRFHGQVDAQSMPRVFQAADCIVIPSLWQETYNYALREALACGCIAVAADIGALPEAMVPGRNGFLFAPGDVASLHSALQKAMDFDPLLYQNISVPRLEQEFGQYERMYHHATTHQCHPTGIQCGALSAGMSGQHSPPDLRQA